MILTRGTGNFHEKKLIDKMMTNLMTYEDAIKKVFIIKQVKGIYHSFQST